MKMSYRIGDAVVLNSGGPIMTILSDSPDGRSCLCSWFSENQNKTMYIPYNCLTPIASANYEIEEKDQLLTENNIN